MSNKGHRGAPNFSQQDIDILHGKICGFDLGNGRKCTQLPGHQTPHSGPPIHSEFISSEKPIQTTASILTNCPCCGYGLHFCCEVGAFYTRSCPVCKAVIKLGIDIVEQTPFNKEELKDKRNQYRG